MGLVAGQEEEEALVVLAVVDRWVVGVGHTRGVLQHQGLWGSRGWV